jgi:CheY-like chemotaxis protein
VVETADGAAALQAVREHWPAVVVSDIDMPVMSGVELCRALRADAATADLPVIFVSGNLMPGDTRPERAGATAIVSKPFLPRELLTCVAANLPDGPGAAP